MKVAILGAGTMGRGIAQVASSAGDTVVVYDPNEGAIRSAELALGAILQKLTSKGRLTEGDAEGIRGRLQWSREVQPLEGAELVIEAIIEDREEKHRLLEKVEALVAKDTIIGTNTSSLSIASLAACLRHPERSIGIHFFNPAPVLPLVEIIAGVQTAPHTTKAVKGIVERWGKVGVIAKDTPGFIVNRIARPFYGEALRILEEGVATPATIDWAIKEIGGFRMGPFELMDFIGNDVNYAVTESVFRSFYYDPRYRPSFTQMRMVEAGLLGRKSGKGYYEYSDQAEPPVVDRDRALGEAIVQRVLVMLINEAIDAVFLGVASPEDIELAMTKGVNYPLGLLAWAEELTFPRVLSELDLLHSEYGEDRYRASPLLRRAVRDGTRSFLGN